MERQGRGGRKKSDQRQDGQRGLQELLAQQQQSGGNPLSLLQQQMSQIMNTQQNNFNNPAAAWWYLEYISRIQAAQSAQHDQQQPQPPQPPQPSQPPQPPQQPQRKKKLQPPPQPPPPQQRETKPQLTKRKHDIDVLNLSKIPRTSLPPKNKPSTATTPTPSTSTPTPSTTPPAAHSTPINLSTPPGKYSTTKEPLPAHINNKPQLYTHIIPKFPQIGLIGGKKEKKKKTVASLLALSRSDPDYRSSDRSTNIDSHSISYRPWLEDKLVIPTIKKDPPDYTLPLKMGWKRETFVKDYTNIENATVIYLTNNQLSCKTINEIKKHLNQRTMELTPKHFSFNTNLILGQYHFEYMNESIVLQDSDVKQDYIPKLKLLKEKLQTQREIAKLKELKEQQDNIDKERKKQHHQLIKSLEILKKNKRRIKQAREKKLKKKLESESEEVKEESVCEFEGHTDLVCLEKIQTCLDPSTFSNLLQIYEFLNTFGETLGFDMDSLPDLESLLKGFINHPENEEELQSILIHLIVCAVEDPGMPNPSKHLTVFGQTLKQADVTFGSLSEILRIYLEGISDGEAEAEILAGWLGEAPFTCHNPRRKTLIFKFLCDVLLSNKAVLKFLETTSELIHNCKKERAANEVLIRKLRMIVARRQVAICDNEDSASVDVPPPPPPLPEAPEEEEQSLSMEELKLKMSNLQNTNEKLKKQMQLNIKNIRTSSLGMDRYRRRYWNLPHSGGVFVEGGVSSEFEELQEKVNLKFSSGVCVKKEEVDQENIPPVQNVFEVPPPVIKIFSFLKETLCSGKDPVVEKKVGPTDDEMLLEKIEPGFWNHYHSLENIEEFKQSLSEFGVRERDLKQALSQAVVVKPVSKFEDTECPEIESSVDIADIGVDPDLVYRVHVGLVETLETLEERVASASLQMKGWTLPLPRQVQCGLKQSEIITIVKGRLLDLEQAVERRYLKPPLGKSANELNLSNLVGEDNANAVTNEIVLNLPPCGSTSSTRGQQIQENNKLKEQKEKEERKSLASASQNSCSRFLTHWRDAVGKSSSPSVLSMAIYLLDSSIAWDKSVMKASCQLCKGGDNEDKLLLCDACDRGYHTYCFKPPLEQIPDGDWFCWECINKATGNRGCIVCGKGNLQGRKLLACDKCVKAYHTDCIYPPVGKVPRGRWYCPDHQPSSSSMIKKIESPSKKKITASPTIIPEDSPPSPSPPPPPPISKKNKKLKKELDWCEKILDDLCGHEDAWPFLEPVNTRQFPTYKKIIKTPIDLSTIRKSLVEYKSREQFLADVQLIFDNCEIFNEDDSPVGKCGHNLRIFFDSLNTTTVPISDSN